MTRFEINKGIALLMGWNVTTIHESVFLDHPVITYGFDYQHCFDILDGSVGSKALCFDLLEKFKVTYHPQKEDGNYRFGEGGAYARCGSHEPVSDERVEKAICMAILAANDNNILSLKAD